MKICKFHDVPAGKCPAGNAFCVYPACLIELSERREQLYGDGLKEAEAAADRFDGLGAPMSMYQPHIAEIRNRAGLPTRPVFSGGAAGGGKTEQQVGVTARSGVIFGPDFNGVVQPVPERFSTEAADGEGR